MIGERLFLTYCSQRCHGFRCARATRVFPNLTDKDWLFGGEPETIQTTIILNGRHGEMPMMEAALGSDRDVENVANYVLSLFGRHCRSDQGTVFGKPKFAVCAPCHGADGRGNQALGAPNLTDKIWLFGGSKETIMETIHHGRSSTMPAFKDFLGEAKVHVLAAYVWSLSYETPAQATQ